jgi:hypothetical protein
MAKEYAAAKRLHSLLLPRLYRKSMKVIAKCIEGRAAVGFGSPIFSYTRS